MIFPTDEKWDMLKMIQVTMDISGPLKIYINQIRRPQASSVSNVWISEYLDDRICLNCLNKIGYNIAKISHPVSSRIHPLCRSWYYPCFSVCVVTGILKEQQTISCKIFLGNYYTWFIYIYKRYKLLDKHDY